MQLKAKKEGKTLASDSHMVTKSYNLGDIYHHANGLLHRGGSNGVFSYYVNTGESVYHITV